jgi:hypothetical protein
MPHTTHARTSWDHSHHWPVAHRSQSDAGLPEGPLHERAPATYWPDLLFGVLIGALLIGPTLAELWGAL